jgi:ABC-type arginine transport system ATPase subunit
MHVESSNVEVSVVNQLAVASRFTVDSVNGSPLAVSVAVAVVMDPAALAVDRMRSSSDPEVTAELVERAILHLSTGQLVTGAAQVQ